MTTVTVRTRTADDLPELVVIGRRTHQQDRYPWRDHGAALGHFLTGPQPALGAWVAEHDGRVVGQAVLAEPTPGWAAAGGLPADVVAISRLLVDPDVRRSGAATALLATAVAAGRPRPVGLDVVLANPGPVCFYERLGWTRTGTGQFVLDGDQVPRGYYLAPAS